MEYGVKVVHSEWTGDFSKHRNEAIDACQGEFILMVDGDDEVFDTDFEETRHILSSGDTSPVLMTRYHLTWPKGDEVVLMVPRLFRRDAGCRYVHAIHEKLAVQEDCPVMMSNIRIRHHGYSTEDELKRKEERNLQIALAMPDDDPHGLHCRARAAMTLNQWPLVRESTRALLDSDCSPLGEVEGCIMLGLASFFLDKLDDLDEAIERAEGMVPGNPDIRYLEFLRAGKRYQECLRDGEEDGSNEFLRPHMMSHSIDRAEAAIAMLLGTKIEKKTEQQTGKEEA